MMEPAEVYEHAEMTVEIHYDENPLNPRSDYDHVGVMFCDHSRYNLGDEDAPDPREQDTTCPVCAGSGYNGDEDVEDDDCPNCEGSGRVDVGIIDYLKREHGARVILPLFLYDHSGISMSAGGRLDTGEDGFSRTNRFTGDGAGWDTSSVGMIFDTAEARERMGFTDGDDEQMEAALRAEVAAYDAYLTGAVYGFIVKFPNGEEYESCWGFYELKDCKSEANAVADWGRRILEGRRAMRTVRGEN